MTALTKRLTLTPRQRTLRKRYTKTETMFRRLFVCLYIGEQRFVIAGVEDYAKSERRKMAAWYRDMLAIALDRIVANEGGAK